MMYSIMEDHRIHFKTVQCSCTKHWNNKRTLILISELMRTNRRTRLVCVACENANKIPIESSLQWINHNAVSAVDVRKTRLLKRRDSIQAVSSLFWFERPVSLLWILGHLCCGTRVASCHRLWSSRNSYNRAKIQVLVEQTRCINMHCENATFIQNFALFTLKFMIPVFHLFSKLAFDFERHHKRLH